MQKYVQGSEKSRICAESSNARLLFLYSISPHSTHNLQSLLTIFAQDTMLIPDHHLGKKVKDYSFQKLLGRGNFGSVYLVEDLKNKCLAACKVIDKVKIKQTPKLGQLINSQICVLFNCQHQNVVSYLASFEDPNYVYILMEYCNGGDVDQYTKKKGGRLTEAEAKEFLRQIIKGFSNIRRINAVHRDFKPENLLMHNGIVKVADLGFSKVLNEQDTTNTVLGTLYTMAPEVIEKKPYGYQCDIWSIGVVYYKLLYGIYPYTGKTYIQMLKKIKNDKLQFDPAVSVSNESKDFISRCLVIDPCQRMSWEEVEGHSLIQSNLVKAELPPLKKEPIPKTKQFYIRNCPILRIRNPPEFPDVDLNSSITQERIADPLENKVLQNRIHSYYQELYLAIRQYIVSRITRGLSLILQFISKIPVVEYHGVAGYIISRQSLRQTTQILESLKQKSNILQLKLMVNEFFQSQEYKVLLELYKNDQDTLVHYVAQFKGLMKHEDLQKLQANQISIPERILQRERRYLIQYAIQLFNNMDKVDKKVALQILLLIQFLSDEVECCYKDPNVYSNFGVGIELKALWFKTREKLEVLRENYK